MDNRPFLIKMEEKNLDVRKELEEVINGFGGFEIQRPGDERRADLLIFELGHTPQKDLQLIQSLLNMGAVGEVLVVAESLDPTVLLQAMRIGAKDFLSQPFDISEAIQVFDRIKKRIEESTQKGPVKSGQIIDVIGSRGGIGNTTIAVNLAVNLAEMNGVKSVALVDMNMLFGDIPLFLDLAPKHHWGEAIGGISRLDNSFLTNMLSQHPSGVNVLASPTSFFSLEDAEMADMDMFERLLGWMKVTFDYVVVDAGISLEKVSLKVIKMADQVLLVSTSSVPCLANTSKILKSFHSLGYPPMERVKVVINHYTRDAEVTFNDVEKSIDKQVFWTIPIDHKATMSAINQGKPLSHVAPKAQITKSLRGLADTLAGTEDHQEKGFFGFLKRSPMPQ